MSADRIRVTVDGEPVSAEVTWEQVRAYLRAKEWTCDGAGGAIETWTLDARHEFVCLRSAGREATMGRMIVQIAAAEQRPPAAVLRDIARGTEAAGVEPLTEGELVSLEAAVGAPCSCSEEQDGFIAQCGRCSARAQSPAHVLRLLATVRARESERDEYARRLSAALDDRIDSLKKVCAR